MEFNRPVLASPKNIRIVDVWYAYQGFWSAYGLATASTFGAGVMRGLYTGNWKTLKTAQQMASFALRAHWNTFKGIINTPFTTEAGSRTLAQGLRAGTASLAAGYALGAVGGIALADILFDEKEMAADLYLPGGASFWDEYWGMPRNIEAIIDHYTG